MHTPTVHTFKYVVHTWWWWFQLTSSIGSSYYCKASFLLECWILYNTSKCTHIIYTYFWLLYCVCFFAFCVYHSSTWIYAYFLQVVRSLLPCIRSTTDIYIYICAYNKYQIRVNIILFALLIFSISKSIQNTKVFAPHCNNILLMWLCAFGCVTICIYLETCYSLPMYHIDSSQTAVWQSGVWTHRIKLFLSLQNRIVYLVYLRKRHTEILVLTLCWAVAAIIVFSADLQVGPDKPSIDKRSLHFYSFSSFPFNARRGR